MNANSITLPRLAAASPDPGESGHERAWRDGPVGCRPGGHVTLFLDRRGYVTGSAPPAAAPAGWHLGEVYSAECAARGDPEDDLRTAAREGSVDAEGWWTRADGSRCWVEATLAALRGAAGALTGFALVVRDASAARRAEEAHRLAEARLAGIVDLAREAIVSADESREIILFNRGAERIFGYTAGEVLGMPVAMLFADGYHDAHAGELLALGSARARREGDVGEVAARRRDGTVFPAAASLSCVDLAGRRLCTWVLRDVTVEKRASAEAAFLLRAGSALASSLDPAATLAAAASLAVEAFAGLCLADALEADACPRRTAAAGDSPAARELAAALAARPYDAASAEPAASALHAGEPRRLAFADADGLAAAGWPAEHARILAELAPGVLHAFPLILHQRRLGVLLLARAGGAGLGDPEVKLAGELAGRVALALESALLYEQSCRAARLRDEMVSVVSHDLRSPLTAIAMAASLLAEADAEPRLTPQRARLVDIIGRSTEQMTRMVGDLLDVARIESGRLDLRPASLRPATVLAEAAHLLRSQAEAVGIALEVEPGDDLPDVRGDPDRLQQVMANLVGNALKFTPAGGTITLRAEPDAEGGVRFSVDDTGSGIPAEHLTRVFDRFWQAGRADRRGLGLGLPIVKGIVEAHGGRIWAESEVGRGSSFRLTLPPAPAEA
ncbi:MAG TPA: PAS domain-containing sensor histidine kinase [Longimicrobium sp.]|nr:PAS domain-containing sensor histidine kinase [Longimicrobium sp.]